MQLNNFNSAWNQIKLLNAMQRIETAEILSIIDSPGNTDTSSLRAVLFSLGIFLVVTIFCQGG